MKRYVKTILWLMFAIFYPMLLSIYVFLPFFIGASGYLTIEYLSKGKFLAALGGVLYFFNLELNLSIPFWVTIVPVLAAYRIRRIFDGLWRCRVCTAIVTVTIIDLLCWLSVTMYDYVFLQRTLYGDTTLWYTYLSDLIAVILL